MSTRIAAVVGATGGAGTTRLTIESAALLAATGRSVAVFDAAVQTQGLAAYTEQRIEDDLTALLTEEADLDETLYEMDLDLPGVVNLCPAWCPFERLSRAKTAGAANRFEQQLAAAALSHDAVLVDTPPIGGNQAIAGVNAADRIGVVAPDTLRGRDGVALTRERLADIGLASDAVVANRSTEAVLDADVHVPEAPETAPRSAPACLPPDDEFTPAIMGLVEALLGVEPDIELPDSGRFSGLLQ
ncbi:AAA family ATPase [Halovenus sp. WSH3]|uniref:AAA family ATPase n=1 Tax=Halovenus carboxidivorans TaxID=2692199 RepID=A0A6B0T0F9_9EURY|nr:ParA family protein [Halovenus carboxidivorans]MXR51658.1 AAA family ATPase [Halovenus carboxidivorans]